MLVGGSFSSTLLILSVLLLALLAGGRSSLARYYHYYHGERAAAPAKIVEELDGDDTGYTFSYTVGDSQYLNRGYDGIFAQSYQVGQQVEAQYCVAHPEIAALPGLYLSKNHPLGMLLLGLLTLFLAWQAIWGLVEGIRIKELLIHGLAADAQLALMGESVPDSDDGSRSRRYAATFKVEGESGARSVPLSWGKAPLKEREIVLYSPTQPTNVVPLGALGALLKVDDKGRLVAHRPGQAFLPPLVFLLAMGLFGLSAYMLSLV